MAKKIKLGDFNRLRIVKIEWCAVNEIGVEKGSCNAR